MSTFLQQLFNGLSIGSIYALIALGYTMVYGVLGLINFAHGEVFMVGTYIALYASGWLGYEALTGTGLTFFDSVLVLLIAMAGAAVLGMSIERLAYRPVRNAPRLTPLITAIGMSLLLQNLAVLIFGTTPRSFPMLLAEDRFVVLGVNITTVKLVILGLAIVLMLLLHFLVQHTWTGKAMRAVSFNLSAARLMGVPADRVIAATFALGSVLAAAGGVMFGLDQVRVDPLMGKMIGLKAFIAAVVGGIGNIRGAVLGGILIGLADQLTTGYLSGTYRDAITFLILIVILLIKPAGLLGTVRPEKV